MSERIHALAQRLFGKATIEECSVEEAKNLAQRFPYFAPAQFFLLEKLKQAGSGEYSSQLQKSILYYPDPLAFQYFIDSDRFYTDFEAAEEFVEEIKEPNLSPTYTETKEAIAAEQENEFVAPGSIVTEEALPVNDHVVAMPEETTGSPEEQTLATENEPVKMVLPELQAQPQDTALTFEPFHTVDYFASQGIRLSQEELPKDKFGKQLKSFTEWLKTMKRLPSTQITAAADAGSESKVQNLAEDSVHDSNVWTEAMAEVWTKQGNTQKAIETYNKLSLLNPSKRAYFATKIENLKRS